MKSKEIKGKIKSSKSAAAELERAYDKIQAWFFAYPQEEFSLNDLCSELQISKTTANITVTHFEKEGFLEKQVLGKLWRIKANLDHLHFIRRKIPFNLKSVYESGVIEWIEKNIPNAQVIILFGSYRKGDDIKESDLDIAVEVIGNKKLAITKGVVDRLGYKRDISVNIHSFSRNHIDLNLFANIANGIVLKGFLEVRP